MGLFCFCRKTNKAPKKKTKYETKVERAFGLHGGTVVNVENKEQACLAEEGGACAVTVTLVTRINGMNPIFEISKPLTDKIKEIKKAISIPVIARCRIGHSGDASILEAIGVDYIDESEFVRDDKTKIWVRNRIHLNKHKYVTPFICGCKNLEEALKRISEGAALLRIQQTWEDCRDAVTGIAEEISKLKGMSTTELMDFSKKISIPYGIVRKTKKLGKLPVPHFAAGNINTPAECVMMRNLGVDGIFLNDLLQIWRMEYFKPIIDAVRHHNDPEVLRTYAW
ncbi:pyridoxal 5'-phosphate synthase subunit PDX1-like [Ziziphus jujuba]|uniref:Pyridoxal 5'-phosphate synthase subunit PDX1-like n=1 Tax=Ziziphus jujuba TaxID=326968 RepID=A0ABM3ZUC1_ZIZJJ|nr:pyridoxal 5'-phosphate synthase subunit PDX1-like [Ziziphus jujuba]